MGQLRRFSAAESAEIWDRWQRGERLKLTGKPSCIVTAKVNALGLAAVTLTGSPACEVKAQGSATVTGCK